MDGRMKRIADLKAKLKAREKNPVMAVNCEELRRMIEREEARLT